VNVTLLPDVWALLVWTVCDVMGDLVIALQIRLTNANQNLFVDIQSEPCSSSPEALNSHYDIPFSRDGHVNSGRVLGIESEVFSNSSFQS
jgi:hypothetical protein